MATGPTDRYSFEQLWHLDGGTLTVDDDDARRLVAKALSYVPADVADRIVDECCFVMPRAAAKGFVAPRQITDGRTIIGLSEVILGNERDALLTVLHEVAHHYLGHKIGLLEDITEEDDVRQEREANKQAEEWLDAAGISPPS